MRKVRTSRRHLLAEKELFMVHGTLNIFFINKTFLFVKIEIWNFQYLFDLLFRETSQNFSTFRQLLFPVEKCRLNIFLNELKFCKVSWNLLSNGCWKVQLSILKNKKVLFLKKIWSVPCTMDSSLFSQQMPYCLLTLLVYMALDFITLTTQHQILLWKQMFLLRLCHAWYNYSTLQEHMFPPIICVYYSYLNVDKSCRTLDPSSTVLLTFIVD